MKQVCFFFFLLFSLQAFSQKIALKNNLAYDALLTPNLSVELSLGKKWTLDTQVGMNFFFYESDATAGGYKTRKWRLDIGPVKHSTAGFLVFMPTEDR